MEVDINRQSSLSLLDTWSCRSGRCCHDGLSYTPLDLTTTDLAHIPRCLAPDPLLDAFLSEVPTRHESHSSCCKVTKTTPSPWTLQSCFGSHSRFSFFAPKPSSKSLSLNIQLIQPAALHQGVKRRRCISDVDGFDTARLSSKKRRLRSEFITSRLSQPYSQPATHILNREGQESGDRRFLKMATSVDMARRVAHLHATSFLRYSIMNSMRTRLGVTHNIDQDPAKTSKLMCRTQSPPVSSAGKALKVCPSDHKTGPPVVSTPTRSPLAAVPQTVKPPACRLSKPAALPLPTTDAAATKRCTSPRIHPVQSPELRPVPPTIDDIEEDSFAFMHPTDDVWDDTGDDQESVYSDFGVLFGQGSEEAQGDDRSYEEYLDELDGICWM